MARKLHIGEPPATVEIADRELAARPAHGGEHYPWFHVREEPARPVPAAHPLRLKKYATRGAPRSSPRRR